PAPPPLAGLAAITQPGPSLVLSVGNPQPGALLPRGKYIMQGLAFDRAATTGSGVDRVSVFVDSRDSGGQLVGDAVLGQPVATGGRSTSAGACTACRPPRASCRVKRIRERRAPRTVSVWDHPTAA